MSTDIQQRITALTERLHHLNYQYYQRDMSEVSDQEFDASCWPSWPGWKPNIRSSRCPTRPPSA